MNKTDKLSVQEIKELLNTAEPDALSETAKQFEDDPRSSVVKLLEQAYRRHVAYMAEKERINNLYAFDQLYGEGELVIGVDEVGRGSVAGPLTVCAVCLPADPQVLGINDSKKITPNKREEIAEKIQDIALGIGICHIPNTVIDEIGMSQALKQAFKTAAHNSGINSAVVLIDGIPLHIFDREVAVVKGDSKSAAIGAASIVAKVTRDALMVEYANQYPEYHLDKCKGYASAEHISAIKTYGLSPIHRKTFCENF